MYRLNSIPEPNYVIAGVLGIAPYTLSQYARGKKPMRADHLVAICRLFQCEPDDVMGWITVEVDKPYRKPARSKK